MPAEAVSALVVTGIALALWAASAALWPSPRTRRRRRVMAQANGSSC